MSRTVHYRGIAREIEATTNQTVEQVAEEICGNRNIKMTSYCIDYENGSWCYLLSDVLYEEYSIINNKLYGIDKEEFNIDEDIIRAERTISGNISFELRYYNGGSSFNECLEEAINKI